MTSPFLLRVRSRTVPTLVVGGVPLGQPGVPSPFRPGVPQDAAPAVGLASGVARRGVLPTVTAAAAGRSTG